MPVKLVRVFITMPAGIVPLRVVMAPMVSWFSSSMRPEMRVSLTTVRISFARG